MKYLIISVFILLHLISGCGDGNDGKQIEASGNIEATNITVSEDASIIPWGTLPRSIESVPNASKANPKSFAVLDALLVPGLKALPVTRSVGDRCGDQRGTAKDSPLARGCFQFMPGCQGSGLPSITQSP